jgi:hypothetical protein
MRSEVTHHSMPRNGLGALRRLLHYALGGLAEEANGGPVQIRGALQRIVENDNQGQKNTLSPHDKLRQEIDDAGWRARHVRPPKPVRPQNDNPRDGARG